jgi:hypothetical protein
MNLDLGGVGKGADDTAVVNPQQLRITDASNQIGCV